MAITVGDLAVDLRLATSVDSTLPAAQTLILTRLLATAETMVAERASSAPSALRDQATIAIAAFMYDKPSSPAGTRYSNAWASSGASEILSRYITRRALVIGAQTATATAEPREPAPSRPMPATPAEAAGGTSTAIRSWTASLIRAAIDARVARIEQRLDALENS